jgi:hypothetical protein
MTLYPTADDFAQLLLSRTLSDIIQEHVFQGLPFVFRHTPQTLDVLKGHLVSDLGLNLSNILVVGSARTGFSLNPHKFPRQFSDTSDIDILIVDEDLFDEIWTTLLRWNYPRRLVKLGRTDNEWIYQRRKDIYWGWFEPDRIRFEGISLPDALWPIRDLSTRWFNAFRGLSQYSEHAELARREVSGRLYRTWNHAYLYHEEGLRLLKPIVQKIQEDKR